MKKVYKVGPIDCAHCAAKMEAQIQKLAGVEGATLSFMTGRLVLETTRTDEDVLKRDIAAICSKIEHDCEVR